MKSSQSKPTEKTAYGLIRFSTDSQQWNDSLRRQTQRAKDECERRGWQFNEKLTLKDLGVSAFRGNNFDRRYALGQFLEASKQGLLLPSPVLLVENLDRFSRDTLDNADTELWSLVKRGVDVLILSNGLHLTKGDENDAAKRAIVLFEFDRAHKESERKSDLVNAAFQQKYKHAANGDKVSFGNWLPRWITFKGPKKGVGTFHLNDKAKTIREIVDASLNGSSMVKISTALRNAKTPCISKHGKKWTQGHVRHILTSEALIGQITIKGKVFKNYLPPVITVEKWKALQAKLEERTTRKGGPMDNAWIANLFPNRCYCTCGSKLKSSSSSGKDKYWYKCSANADKDGTCNVHYMLPIRHVEHDFFGFYLQELPTQLHGKANKPKHKTQVNDLKATLAEAKNDRDKTTDLWNKTKTDKLAALVVEANDYVTKLEQDLATAHKQMLADDSTPLAMENLKAIVSEWDNAKTEQQEAEAIYKHGQATNTLLDQLADAKERAKMLEAIPSLVQRLTIDLEKRRYKVATVSGTESDWRDLAIFK